MAPVPPFFSGCSGRIRGAGADMGGRRPKMLRHGRPDLRSTMVVSIITTSTSTPPITTACHSEGTVSRLKALVSSAMKATPTSAPK